MRFAAAIVTKVPAMPKVAIGDEGSSQRSGVFHDLFVFHEGAPVMLKVKPFASRPCHSNGMELPLTLCEVVA
jgi:hypothetical protein